MDDDYVWIHDYHLLVLPSLLRKRFHRMRCGLFLHSPFPSSEIFRTFPKREELLRSLLNADLIGQRFWVSRVGGMLGVLQCTTWISSLPFQLWQGLARCLARCLHSLTCTESGSLRPPTCLLPPGAGPPPTPCRALPCRLPHL